MATSPRLTISPENSADTGAGAAVWASGNQPWNGTNPALVAKPGEQQRQGDDVDGRGVRPHRRQEGVEPAEVQSAVLGVQQRDPEEHREGRVLVSTSILNAPG